MTISSSSTGRAVRFVADKRGVDRSAATADHAATEHRCRGVDACDATARQCLRSRDGPARSSAPAREDARAVMGSRAARSEAAVFLIHPLASLTDSDFEPLLNPGPPNVSVSALAKRGLLGLNRWVFRTRPAPYDHKVARCVRRAWLCGTSMCVPQCATKRSTTYCRDA